MIWSWTSSLWYFCCNSLNRLRQLFSIKALRQGMKGSTASVICSRRYVTQKGERLHDLQNIHLHIDTSQHPTSQGWWGWQWACSGWLAGDIGGCHETTSPNYMSSEDKSSQHHWRGAGQEKRVVVARELSGKPRWYALWRFPEGASVWSGGEERSQLVQIITTCKLRVYSILVGVA